MLHHVSFAVQNPQRAAEVVAELWQGQVIPFPEHHGSYIALQLDQYGSAIEFLPKHTVLTPGEVLDPCQFSALTAVPIGYTASHVNLAVPTSEEKIYEIAAREGWRVVKCQRAGFFELIEFWLENEILLELITPPMMERYLATMRPENLTALLQAAIAAP
ncbi:MAG: hypothetical protein VKJ24_02170 [Synechococcales bacterium]|nr:hypothetical protein [Synechococcales bacterium]